MGPAVWALFASSALAANGVVQFNLARSQYHPSGQSVAERLSRRDIEPDTLDLENEQLLYTAELEIGSNKQKVHAQVDTGSSDLWVMDASNPYCASISQQPDSAESESSSTGIDPDSDKIQCFAEYMFASKNSTSFKANGSTPFSITYGDYTFANGTYCTDDIVIGGDTIKGANFALAVKANSSQAVFGIGLETTEASLDVQSLLDTDGGADGPLNGTYANLPVQMKQEGLISRVAYSLYLDDAQAESGSLLLGGVDHAKYSGSLQTVPLVSEYEEIDVPIDFSVMLHGVSGYNSKNETAQIATLSTAALLDSGTSYIIMPSPLLDPIMESMGALYSEEMGYYFAPCDGGWVGGGLDFDFSGVTIRVPFAELVQQMEVSYGKKSERLCLVTMLPSSSEFILGDTFLRSAYVVYDLENKEISLAQVKSNVTASSIESIPATGTVPGATSAASYSSTEFSTGVDSTFATIFGLSTVASQFNSSATYLPFSSIGPLSALTFDLLGFGDTAPTTSVKSSGKKSKAVETSSGTASGSGSASASGSGDNDAAKSGSASGTASASGTSSKDSKNGAAGLPSITIAGLLAAVCSMALLL